MRDQFSDPFGSGGRGGANKTVGFNHGGSVLQGKVAYRRNLRNSGVIFELWQAFQHAPSIAGNTRTNCFCLSLGCSNISCKPEQGSTCALTLICSNKNRGREQYQPRLETIALWYLYLRLGERPPVMAQ